MKKIFLVILTLPLLSLASDTDPNLVFQPDGATSTALGTTKKGVCALCKHKNKVRLGVNTNALPGASGNSSSDTGDVGTGQ